MKRLNLLPPRYREARLAARSLTRVMALAAVLVAALGTVHVAITAQTRSYQLQVETLRQDAGQYRKVNLMMDSLVKAEQTLNARRDKASPLLDRGGSILPVIDQLTRGLPDGTWLSRVALGADGRVELEGETRTFQDVSRFVKWLGAVRGYQQVKLARVSKMTVDDGGAYITFQVSAVRPGLPAKVATADTAGKGGGAR